jgi:cholesterol transport system auxiliary component
MKHADMTRRVALALLAGGAGASLAGCGTVINAAAGNPPRLFRLSSKSTFPDDIPDVDWQLVVDTPSAPASINTNRIGLMETPYRFNYFAEASWVDRAPLMVQNLIIESFDNSEAIIGVGPASIGLRPNFVLQPELREFQAHQEGDSQRVNVTINVRLVQMPERIIIAVEHFSRETIVPAGAIDPVIDGFDEALGKVLKRLVVWTLAEGEKSWQAKLKAQRRTSSRRSSSSGSSSSAAPVRPIRRLNRPNSAS